VVTRKGQKDDEMEDHAGALSRRVTHLLDNVILPRCSTSPRVFKAQAKVLLSKGEYKNALEAHLNAYRCGPAKDPSVVTDRTKFVHATEELENLVDVLENLGAKKDANGKDGLVASDWKFQARSLLRTFMGRTKDSFEETEEWERLKETLDGLKNRG